MLVSAPPPGGEGGRNARVHVETDDNAGLPRNPAALKNVWLNNGTVSEYLITREYKVER